MSTLTINLAELSLNITDDVTIAIPEDFIKQTSNPWSPGNGPANATREFTIHFVGASNGQNVSMSSTSTLTANATCIRSLDDTQLFASESSCNANANDFTIIRELLPVTLLSGSLFTVDYPIKLINAALFSTSSIANAEAVLLPFELQNAETNRTYITNQYNNDIFGTNTPVLSDPGNEVSDNYQITIFAPIGKFLLPDYETTSTLDISGTLSEVNTSLANDVEYASGYNYLHSVTFTINVYKNSNLYRTYNFNASSAGTISSFPEEGIYGQINGGSEDTIIFDNPALYRLKLGYLKADLLLVGGGGCAGSSGSSGGVMVAGGGGGAGAVLHGENKDLKNYMLDNGYTRLRLVTGHHGGFNDEGSPGETTGGGASYILGYDPDTGTYDTSNPLALAMGGGDGGDAQTLQNATNGKAGANGGGGGATVPSYTPGLGGSGGSKPLVPNENSAYTVTYTDNIPGVLNLTVLDGGNGANGTNYTAGMGFYDGGDGGDAGGYTSEIFGYYITYAIKGQAGVNPGGNPSPGTGGSSFDGGDISDKLGADGATIIKISKL